MNKENLNSSQFKNFVLLGKVKANPLVLEFIRQSELSLQAISFTEHGLRHATLVSDRARNIALDMGLGEREAELAAIAGFCHDIGNFIGRTGHHYWGSLLFHQIFASEFSPADMAHIMQAIANHDKEEDMKFTNPIAALIVLSDKSDVSRKRVMIKDPEEIKKDIHDRVNYATTEAHLKVDKVSKTITLTLKIDTKFVQIMEYFEIFTSRMSYCRTAAEYLKYDFDLVINDIKLL